MAYPYPQFYGGQPWQYQDQLNQLRSAPMVTTGMIGPAYRSEPGINWVQGEAGARAWMVAPGSVAMLMDSERSVFYIKSTDASGVPMPMRTFDYTERIGVAPQSAGQSTDFSVFVTREELNQRLAAISQISTKDGKEKEVPENA